METFGAVGSPIPGWTQPCPKTRVKRGWAALLTGGGQWRPRGHPYIGVGTADVIQSPGPTEEYLYAYRFLDRELYHAVEDAAK